jgi:hypothetical protein
MADAVGPPAIDDMKQAVVANDNSTVDAARGGGGQAAAGGGGGATVTIETLQINGVAGAEDIAPRLGELLTRLLEGDAVALGAA